MTEKRMHCPPAETVAAFAEGRLEPHGIPELMAHLATCEDCLTAIEVADEHIEDTQTPAEARSWRLALVAAAVAAVAVASLFVLRPWRSPIDRLVAAAPRSVRVVEPRLTGGFGWAAYRGPMRAAEVHRDRK